MTVEGAVTWALTQHYASWLNDTRGHCHLSPCSVICVCFPSALQAGPTPSDSCHLLTLKLWLLQMLTRDWKWLLLRGLPSRWQCHLVYFTWLETTTSVKGSSTGYWEVMHSWCLYLQEREVGAVGVGHCTLCATSLGTTSHCSCLGSLPLCT